MRVAIACLAAVLCAFGSAANAGAPFYGVMPTGGHYGGGYVYELTPPPHRAIVHLYDFCAEIQPDGNCFDGKHPVGSIYVANPDMLIGATSHGGVETYGTVYALLRNTDGPAWTHYIIDASCWTFFCTDHMRPTGGFSAGDNGWIYSAAANAKRSRGVVFEFKNMGGEEWQMGPLKWFHQ